MAYTVINKSTTNFNTKLYTGNSNGSNSQTISVGMAPNFTWIKPRASGDNRLFDTIRGVYKDLISNGNSAEANSTTSLTAFNSDGFVVGSENGVNSNNDTFASWNWKAGTAVSGSTTGSGTAKTYTGSVNTTAGFSIIKYTGNGTAGHTIPHRLGVTPSTIFVKMTSDTGDWSSYHSVLGNTKYMRLSGTGAATTSSTYWNNTSPNSTNFTVGTTGNLNGNDSTFIAYCFADVQGYSKMGSYIGNSNADGTFVYTGFKPAFVLLKSSTSVEEWAMFDNKRLGYNPDNNALIASSSSAEATDNDIDFLSNGFKLRRNTGYVNDNGKTYIYMAFGQSIVGSNDTPATAR